MNTSFRLKLDHFVEECRKTVPEVYSWDVEETLETNPSALILDIREPCEFDKAHIKGSLLVPRGVLEAAVDLGFEETVEKLVEARDKEVIVVCRSGVRSVLAAKTLQLMGFNNVKSLKAGLRGWDDAGYALFNKQEKEITEEESEKYFYRGNLEIFRK